MVRFIVVDFVQDKDIILTEEHVMEGLTCIVSVIVPKPEFEGQTQVRKIIVIVNPPLWKSYLCSKL